MYNTEDYSKIFDNHASFNRFQSVSGMRQVEIATKPSIYITEVKLKKALQELSDIEIENIYDNEMTRYRIRLKRDSISKKISSLQEWQLLKALNLLIHIGRIESIEFITKCKRTDKNIDE